MQDMTCKQIFDFDKHLLSIDKEVGFTHLLFTSNEKARRVPAINFMLKQMFLKIYFLTKQVGHEDFGVFG